MVEITFAWLQLLFLSTSLTPGEEQLTQVSKDALDLKTGSFPYQNHPLGLFQGSTLPAQVREEEAIVNQRVRLHPQRERVGRAARRP